MPVISYGGSSSREKATTNWQAPPFKATAEERMAWVEDQLLEAEGWLEGQQAYKDAGSALETFNAIFKDSTKSGLVTNKLKYNIRKFVETISEVREIASYSSDAPQYKKYAEMVTRISRAVYLESQYPRQLRKALQYAAVLGRGYLWSKCKAENYGWGERRLVFEPLGLMDVLPSQVPSSGDVQDAYAVTVYEYMPIAEAHARFPLFQDKLVPVDKVGLRSRLQARQVDSAERMRYGQGGANRGWGNLYCQIRYTYVKDISINRCGSTLPMGEPGTSWFYNIPSIGEEIFGGMAGGAPITRLATPEDCRIYPYLRLIITSAGMNTPMYDGPSFDWHGKIPVVQIDVDDWAWEGVGKSLVSDVQPIERTKRKLERKMDQVIQTTLNPPLGYDNGATGGPKMENFDIFEENLRAGVNGQPKQVLQSLLPEGVNVSNEHFNFLKYLDDAEKQQMGLDDLGSLANLKANVTADAADKAIESIGPLARGIAANVEQATAAIGEMLKFQIVQWFDTKRIIEYIGADNVTPEVFDFDPASIVPSHMPNEMGDGEVPLAPSYYDKIERARRFARNLRLMAVPSTLMKTTQQQEQLKYLQLSRGGFPISNATVAKKLDIPNYGEVEGNTEREKWFNEQRELLLMKAEMTQMAAQLAPPQPDGAGGGPGKGGARKGGRPPSGTKPPKIEQKGAKSGNPRTVVRES